MQIGALTVCGVEHGSIADVVEEEVVVLRVVLEVLDIVVLRVVEVVDGCVEVVVDDGFFVDVVVDVVLLLVVMLLLLVFDIDGQAYAN